MAKDNKVETPVEAPPAVEEAPVSSNAVVGSQFMQLISRDENGLEIKAMKLGEAGILVSYGISLAFVPNGDIKTPLSGICIS